MYEVSFLIKILAVIVLLFIIAYIIKKELSKKIKKQEKNEELSKKINKKQEKEIVQNDNSNPVDKMMDLLEQLPIREESEVNNYNANFFAQIINDRHELENSYQKKEGEIFLSDGDFLEIREKLDIKLGNELSPFVRRVDKDGRIILGMEALRFITGDHIPLITPEGSIRVYNFLTIEEDLLLSIQTGKPVFIYDKEKNKIYQIPKDQINKIIIDEETIKLNEMLQNRKDNIEKLIGRNEILENENKDNRQKIYDLKEEISKLNGKLEIYEKLVNSNKTDSIKKQKEEKKESLINKSSSQQNVANINQDDELKVSEVRIEKDTQNITENKKESLINKSSSQQNVANINQDDELKVSEVRIEKDTQNITENKKESLINKSNSQQNVANINQDDEPKVSEVRIEKDTQNEVKLKTINKTSAFDFKKAFFVEKILINLNNKNIDAEKLMYLSFEKEQFSSKIKIKYIHKNIIKNLKEFLKQKGYEDTNESIKKFFELGKIEIKEDSYFLKNNDKKIYKGDLIEINFIEEDLYGIMLLNEKDNGYSGGFTLKEYTAMRDITNRNDLKNIYKRIVESIENNDFINIEERKNYE